MKQKLKLPRLDNGRGKWRGRERYILHLGEDHDKGLGMDTVAELGMDLPMKIQFHLKNGLFDHGVFISEMVLRSRSVHHGANSLGMKWMKCERRRREGSEKRESVAENFGREMKMKKEFATVITPA